MSSVYELQEMSQKRLANVFGFGRYVALAWKDENNIVDELSPC